MATIPNAPNRPAPQVINRTVAPARYLVANESLSAETVLIVNVDGQKDEVFIQPQSRVKLPEGYRVVDTFARVRPYIVIREL